MAAVCVVRDGNNEGQVSLGFHQAVNFLRGRDLSHLKLVMFPWRSHTKQFVKKLMILFLKENKTDDFHSKGDSNVVRNMAVNAAKT